MVRPLKAQCDPPYIVMPPRTGVCPGAAWIEMKSLLTALLSAREPWLPLNSMIWSPDTTVAPAVGGSLPAATMADRLPQGWACDPSFAMLPFTGSE